MSVNQSYNDLEIKLFKYEWTIKNFTLHMKLGLVPDDSSYYGTCNKVTIKSPFFHLDHTHIKWYLGLSTSSTSSYEIGLWAEFHSLARQSKRKMKIQYTLENSNTKKKCDGITSYHILSNSHRNVTLGIIPTELLSNNIKDSDYDITIICHFHIVGDSYTSATTNPTSKMIERNLSMDIKELFNQKKFTDFTFILGNKKIQAHKTILMARSPVFAALFSLPMKEKNDNEAIIDDIDYEVFEEMLQYIYTDDVSNLKCSPEKLLYAADKYELKDLKEMCGVLLQKGITINNAADLFIFADQHNLTQLSENISRFIRGHIGEFLNSPGYEKMVRKHPNIAFKVLKLPALKP